MATIVENLSRASGIQVDDESLKAITIFCGFGLFVSLLCVSYGFDLVAEFF
jgi:hypothetical protein